MKKEILGKYVTQNWSEEIHPLTEQDEITIQEITKITDSIELLKKMEAIDSIAALHRVKANINKKQPTNWLLYLQRIAAILILPLFLLVVLQTIHLTNIDNSIQITELTTPPTLRSFTTLPDGTKVWLNGNTTISYPNRFTGNERMVTLSGEAFFEVATDKHSPFIVQINHLLVQATGTQFNIASYPGEALQEILLTEGSVSIHYQKENERKFLTDLTVNEMALFDNNNRNLKVKKVEPLKYIAWKNGKIIFSNDALSEVTKKLERWYNVEFTYHTGTNTEHAFTGAFAGENLSQILKCIELTTPIRFKIEEPAINLNHEYEKTRIKITDKQ